MNRIKSGALFLSAVMLFLMMPLSAWAVHVSFYLGDVSVIRNAKKVPVSMGAAMEPGDMIKTGSKSTMELVYNDGSKVTIMERSTAKVGSSTVKNSDSVTLLSGNVKGKFSKLKKGSHKVYTPTVICAIRGTEFTVSVSRSGDSRVDLAEGKLAINNPYGKTDITQGEKVEAQVSEAPDKSDDLASVREWQKNKQQELLSDPKKKSEQYKKHIESLKSRSEKDSESVSDYGDMVSKADGKKEIEEAGDKISTEEESISDDLIMSEASNVSIENIMQDFEKRDKGIFKRFRKLKKEANKVLEQQQKNYEAIQAIKKAHQEARDRIMGKYQQDKDAIFNKLNKDDVKPKLK